MKLNKYYGWGKSETKNSEGRLVFWEILEELEEFPFTGEIHEVLEKTQALYERLQEEGVYNIFEKIEIEDEGYMNLRYDDAKRHFIVGRRTETDSEFSLRQKMELEEEKTKKELEMKKVKEKEQKEYETFLELNKKFGGKNE